MNCQGYDTKLGRSPASRVGVRDGEAAGRCARKGDGGPVRADASACLRQVARSIVGRPWYSSQWSVTPVTVFSEVMVIVLLGYMRIEPSPAA